MAVRHSVGSNDPHEQSTTALTRYLKTVWEDYFERNNTRMANAIGISLPAIARVLDGKQGLSNENLLRLAGILGESADTLLRAVGRADIADLFKEHYGDPAGTAEERALVSEFKKLEPAAQRAIATTVRLMARNYGARRRPTKPLGPRHVRKPNET